MFQTSYKDWVEYFRHEETVRVKGLHGNEENVVIYTEVRKRLIFVVYFFFLSEYFRVLSCFNIQKVMFTNIIYTLENLMKNSINRTDVKTKQKYVR